MDGSRHIIEKDLRERIAIALFCVDSILNIQHGGYFNVYQPANKDFDAFTGYSSTFFKDFELANGKQFTTKELVIWKNFVQEEQQKFELQTCNTVSANLIGTTYRRATTQPKYGHTILILIERDLTDANYRSGQDFFSGSRAGELTKRILCRQNSWANISKAIDTSLFDSTPFLFVDLFPWPGTTNHEGALLQLEKYMNIIQPLVTITFSLMVTSVDFSNFFTLMEF